MEERKTKVKASADFGPVRIETDGQDLVAKTSDTSPVQFEAAVNVEQLFLWLKDLVVGLVRRVSDQGKKEEEHGDRDASIST